LRAEGYKVHIVFLWLSSPDEAVARVAERVKAGGHDVPEATIRRRYRSGVRNFFGLYMPLADSWQLIDNSEINQPRRVALGSLHGVARIDEPLTWRIIQGKVQEP
jgi:predicted ABC-type ATPase